MKTLEITVKNRLYNSVLNAIKEACEKVNANFKYEVGYRSRNNATHLAVYIDNVRRTNMKFYHANHGVGVNHVCLLEKVSKLFENKYDTLLKFKMQ